MLRLLHQVKLGKLKMSGKRSVCCATAPVAHGVVLAPVSGMLTGMEGQRKDRASVLTKGVNRCFPADSHL